MCAYIPTDLFIHLIAHSLSKLRNPVFFLFTFATIKKRKEERKNKEENKGGRERRDVSKRKHVYLVLTGLISVDKGFVTLKPGKLLVRKAQKKKKVQLR